MLAHKQNVFDDFHAAAERWSRTADDQQPAGDQRRSNGGLLVGPR